MTICKSCTLSWPNLEQSKHAPKKCKFKNSSKSASSEVALGGKHVLVICCTNVTQYSINCSSSWATICKSCILSWPNLEQF